MTNPVTTLHGLYGITDATLLPDARLFTGVEQALQAGVRLIQYRNKSGDARKRLLEARQLVALCEHYSGCLIINDDVQLCRDSGAHGVHLGQTDTPVDVARQELGSAIIIGATCHQDIALAHQAQEMGASYVAFGRFFPSFTKPGAPAADLSVLQAAKEQLTVPTVAIGGVNAENGASLLASGANMLAVAHSLFATNDIKANAESLLNLFQQQR
ncbi:MAG: thiamine phosphate synthase [Gammaproteobacteria bacterium]